MTGAKKFSRREFLKLCTGGAANTLTQAAAAALPNVELKERQRVRLDNLAKSHARAEVQANATCARCAVPFLAELNDPLCAACHAQEQQAQSLLSALLPTAARQESSP